MTAQDIIQRGEAIKPVSELYGNAAMFLTILLAIVAAFTISLIVANYIERKGGSDFVVKMSIAACVLVMAGGVALHVHTQSELIDQYNTATMEWKETHVYPYIRSLDHTDLELTSIRENNGSQEPEHLPYPDEIIEYRDENQVIKKLNTPEDTDWDVTNGRQAYQLIHDVPAGQKPFVRFYELETDLGHGMNPGAYGLDIHLNEKQ